MIEKTRRYITDRRFMKCIKDIFESYEDVCMLSVIEENLGLIEIVYPDSQEGELDRIVEDLRNHGIQLWKVEGG